MKVPSTTLDFIKVLEDLYPDIIECDPAYVGTPDYWKKVGIIELIRKINIKHTDSSLEKV